MKQHPPGLIAILTRPAGLTASWPCIIQLDRPAGTGHAVLTGTAIPKLRNQAVSAMFTGKFEWLLFIDDDQTFPPDALIRLLDAERPVIGSVIAGKYHPFQPWIFFDDPDQDGQKMLRRASHADVPDARGITEVGAVGTGFALIRRTVFEEMKEPWFENAPLAVDGVGEDIYFCVKARALGFGVFVDMGLKVGHLTVMNVVLDKDGQPQLTHERHMRRQTIT